MRYILSLLSISAVVLFFLCGTTSCKKTGIIATNDTATLFLELHTTIDSTEVDSVGKFYPDTLGRSIALSVAQFYISGVSLTDASGYIYTIPGAYVLKTMGTKTYLVGTIPAGNFISISFNVGLDAGANATSPADVAPPSPLRPQNPSMWFGNVTDGYIFMNIQGYAQDSTGRPVVPISYKIGTLVETVTLPTHVPSFNIAPKQVLTVSINCDYGKLLRCVPSFSASPATDTYNTNPNLSTVIATNIPYMFYYRQ